MQEVTGSNPVFPKKIKAGIRMGKIKLFNGQEAEIADGLTFGEAVKIAFPEVAKKTLAVEYGKVYDLSTVVLSAGDAVLKPLTFEEDKGKEVFWHSSAHVLAQAVKRLYPKAQLTFGPVVKSGPGFFYYDIFLEDKITEADFAAIENEMHKIVSENHSVVRKVLSREEAIREFRNMGEEFKIRIIEELPEGEEISVYSQGDFQDLCRGPHVSSTGRLGFFKLTAVAGAYWKGDTSNPMLQRLYGVSFPDKKDLKNYLNAIEEAKKRDHRKIGKEMDLFSFQDEGPGFPFFHGKGMVIYNLLTDYIRKECLERGYSEIRTPTILSDELWVRSGHYANFKENMYFTTIDEKGYAVKPMNCPGSILIYKNSPKSYRDLPIRVAEMGSVHRHELSGVLHGLFRVRAFTQDDAHIYCEPSDLQKEIEAAIKFVVDVYRKFGFEKVKIFIATRPEKALGSAEVWEKATSALVDSLKNMNLDYKIKEGEGAFYGPKIEFNIEDALQRNWQLGTIQVDFSMPERFEMEYTGSDGQKHRPVMIHRAILGSFERFMGILIEHYEGKLPLWLAPVQVSVMTVLPEDVPVSYAHDIAGVLRGKGFRVEENYEADKIGYKIREWNQKKINYAIIIGKNEADARQISVRKRGEADTVTLSLNEFIQKLHDEMNG